MGIGIPKIAPAGHHYRRAAPAETEVVAGAARPVHVVLQRPKAGQGSRLVPGAHHVTVAHVGPAHVAAREHITVLRHGDELARRRAAPHTGAVESLG